MAYPGDFIAHAEECVPGAGTIEENGNVYSTLVGKAEQDKNLTMNVHGKGMRMLAKGDLVHGVVMNIYAQIALVRFETVEKNIGAANTYAYIRISEIQRGFLENFRDAFRIGDYVKCQVKEVTPMGIYLTMIFPGLGVTRAFCSRCRTEMKGGQNGEFQCPKCSSKEIRKTTEVSRL